MVEAAVLKILGAAPRFLLLPHNLDVMHIVKNICDNLHGTLLKLEGKTKDTMNARLDLADMGI